MKNLGIRKPVSVYERTKLEPVYKADYLGDGKYKATKVGEKEVPLVERGKFYESLFLGRKAQAVKPMWAVWRVRRSRTGQLKLF